MEFILVSPLDSAATTTAGGVTKEPGALMGETAPSKTFENRLSDRAAILRQISSPLHVPVPGVITIDGTSVKILEATMTDVASGRVVSMLVEVTAEQEAPPLNTPQLETILTNSAIAFLGTIPDLKEWTVRWVGRYQLLGCSESPVPDWLHPESVRQRIEAPASSESAALEFHIGWGNGTFVGFHDLPADVREDALSGLIDAQYIWAETDRLGLIAIELLSEVSFTQERVTRSKLRSAQHTSEQLSTLVATHQVAYDDLILNIQGPRFLVAESALRAWDYEKMFARIEARVGSISDIVTKQDQRAGRRYRSAVELILSGLGLLTIIDVALSFIGTAFSGNVEGAPGINSSIGLFHFIRSFDADLLVLLNIAVIGMIVAIILVWRKI